MIIRIKPPRIMIPTCTASVQITADRPPRAVKMHATTRRMQIAEYSSKLNDFSMKIAPA